LNIPIAHAEGRYYASPEMIRDLNENDQIIFRYCDANGQLTNEANPNGSIDNIAGVRNKQGNVFGMMPHPERAADPELGNTDGLRIFESLLASIAV
jgi:phosphoribosylformylglycinamidine synthase